jgi:hypothetical protein
MKKSIITGGIAAGLLLIAALVIYIFFPGILTYIDVKVNDPHINDVAEEFQKVDVPGSFNSFSAKGIKLSMPVGAEKNRSGSSVSKGEEISVLVMENDSYKNFVHQQEMAEDPDLDIDVSTDPWENFLYDEETYRHFYKSMKAQYPTEYDARTDVLWFIKDGFTAKDCLKLRGMDRKVFKEFADVKEESVAYEDAYKIKGDGFFAYVCRMKKSIDAKSLDYEEKDSQFQWTYTLFPDDSTTKYYFIMISGENDEIKPQVISSIELDK